MPPPLPTPLFRDDLQPGFEMPAMENSVALADLGSQPSHQSEYGTQGELDDDDGQLEARRDRQEFSLPVADGGKDAWLFLAACFVVEATVWGNPISFQRHKPALMRYCIVIQLEKLIMCLRVSFLLWCFPGIL
jgi:hypothetical protein